MPKSGKEIVTTGDIPEGVNSVIHRICDRCWNSRWPDLVPYRMSGPIIYEEYCCICHETTLSGIYTKAAPDAFGCEGVCEEVDKEDY